MKEALRIRPSSTSTSSMTASPTPWAAPPSIWPMAWRGLSNRPTSWDVVSSTTLTRPRSQSTSTIARWAENANDTWASPWPFSSRGEGRGMAELDLRLDRLGGDRSQVGLEVARQRHDPAFDQDEFVGGRRRGRRRRGVRSRTRTSSQAACTAPPDIQDCRLAEVDPAEPTVAVAAGASTTSSTPRTSRVICWARVTKPCPTSAQAQVTVATPPSRRQMARTEVVETLGEHQVLEAQGDRLAATERVRGSAVRPAPPGRDIGSPESEAGGRMVDTGAQHLGNRRCAG